MSTLAQRRALLMPHAERQALIRTPVVFRSCCPVQRWGGIQLMNDEEWMQELGMWKLRYVQHPDELEALL